MITHSCHMSSVLVLVPLISPQTSQCDPTARSCPAAGGGLSSSHLMPLTLLLCSCYRQSLPALPGIPKDPNPGCERQPPRAGHTLRGSRVRGRKARPGTTEGPGTWGRCQDWPGYPLPRPRMGVASHQPLLTLQLIQTISVVDRDEPQGGHRFYFRLVPEAASNPHFALLDIQGELPLNPQILGCTEGGTKPPHLLPTL